MTKQRNKNKTQNLRNIDSELYRLIDAYNINQQYLSEKIFAEEYKDAGNDDSAKKKLVARFRNKLLGFGKMHPTEYIRLQEALLVIAEDMMATVSESISKRNVERKEKIKKILEGLDEESLEELLNSY